VKRVLWAVAAVVAAIVVLVAFTLPPTRLTLTGADDGTVSGVLHIHTNRSDGRSAPDEVASAAARAGLGFIVLTDHGDATRILNDHGDAARFPDPPTYRAGVLCLDGVEISTTGGHYIAIGLPAAPYPLGGEPRDVVEDVARLGGFGVAAHADSPKQDLQWDGWSTPFDGLEVINPDTSWRVHATQGGLRGKLRLLHAISAYPFRPPEAIASILTDTSALMSRWETLTRDRRVVAVAGTDAHALALFGPIRMPDYEYSFRMLSVRVKPDRPLTGSAAADADSIIGGLRAGHVYTVVDGFATSPSFQFSATNLTGSAQPGDELAAGGPVTLRVSSNAPPAFETTIWRGGQILEARRHASSLTVTAPADPAVYRVEIRASDRRDLPPWLVSNPIYVRPVKNTTIVAEEPKHVSPASSLMLFDGSSASAWRVEEGPGSRATMRVVARKEGAEVGELNLQYALPANPAPDSRVALIVFREKFLGEYDRVTFSARADRPIRISVQLRTERPGVADERWHRSVYIDQTRRTHTVYFNDLTPLGRVPSRTPPVGDMPYVLFVIDATNAEAGSSGQFWISDVALQR